MKVLHVESGRHLYGGALQVRYLMEGLGALGVENVLVCPPGSAISQAASNFAQVVEEPMGGDVDVGMTLRLKRTIDAYHPDLVHLHSRRGADSWGALAAKWAKVSCVLSRRVDNPESGLGLTLKYPLYNHIITISEGIRAVLLSQGVPAEKVTCVRSALDPAPYLHPAHEACTFLRNQYGLSQEAPVLAMVAQLIERKGHRYLLDALPELLREFPDWRVLLFGKGPLEGVLREAIKAPALMGRVQLAGFREDLPRLMGGIDLLVHPADREGLGIALLQASAAAVPIVASRAGGIPEAVLDGENGLLVPPGDVSALTAALRTLMADAHLRARMGQAGRTRILADFSVSAMSAGNLAVYHKVCHD